MPDSIVVSHPLQPLRRAPTLSLLRALALLGLGFLAGLMVQLEAPPLLPPPPPSPPWRGGGGSGNGVGSSGDGGGGSSSSSSSSSAALSAAAPAPDAPPPQLRTLLALPPAVDRVIINIGSSKDPPAPPDERTAVIAVEPIPATALAIPRHPLTFVIVAAISNASGFANFFTYNRNGESSTLAQLPEAVTSSTHSSKWWAQDNVRPADVPPVLFVPVLTLAQLLGAIPPRVRVAFLKTDMQGYDFTAVAAAGRALRRAEVVQAEVLCHMGAEAGGADAAPTNFAFNPNAPRNGFDEDWAAHMEALGYALRESPCRGWPTEGDAVWEQAGACGGGGCYVPPASPSPSAAPPQEGAR